MNQQLLRESLNNISNEDIEYIIKLGSAVENLKDNPNFVVLLTDYLGVTLMELTEGLLSDDAIISTKDELIARARFKLYLKTIATMKDNAIIEKQEKSELNNERYR